MALCFNYLLYYKHSLTLSKLLHDFFSFGTAQRWFDLWLVCNKFFLWNTLLSGFCVISVRTLVCSVSWSARTRTTPRVRCLTCRRNWSSRRLSWAEEASCSGWTRMTGSQRTNWPKLLETGKPLNLLLSFFYCRLYILW